MNASKPELFYEPKAIMSIHGILSTGKWQTVLKPVIEARGCDSLEYRYGIVFPLGPFLFNRRVRRFRNWYFETVKKSRGLYIKEPYHRPSIVAHSMGSLIIAKALNKYPEIRFDKIFLHGAIIPRDFDWYSLILRDQVGKIITEISHSDYITRLGFFLTGKLYSCGRYEFSQRTRFCKYEYVDKFDHSDFQYADRFDEQLEKHLYDSPTQIRIIHGEDLTLSQLRKYFKQTEKIDYEVYKNYNESPISIDHALEWAEIEKDIWSFITNSYTEDVMGYVNVMAVNDTVFKNFVSGKLKEKDIEAENIISFDSPGRHNFIIMSLTLQQSISSEIGSLINSKHGELLTFTLLNKLIRIANNGSRLKTISAIGWTPVGAKLCMDCGLEDTGMKYDGHVIYSITAEKLRKKKLNTFRPLFQWWIKAIKENL
jgi:pimeloyl-ACP methyl ester carboxylesterase